jgi:hypothetical protein
LLDLDDAHLANATLNVSAFVVESAANFEEGTNGLGTYPHIVRNIQVLGHERQGTGTVSLPTTFDGDDLEVHLLYEIVPNEPEPVVEENGQDCSTDGEQDCESEDTPALSVPLTLVAACAAVLFTRGRPNFDRRQAQPIDAGVAGR